MKYQERKNKIKELQAEFDQETLGQFQYLGTGGHYTNEQKYFAFGKIEDIGVRATSRLLKVSRRTLQRWCRKYHISVDRCPEWVFGWAERRRNRKQFWALRGYK